MAEKIAVTDKLRQSESIVEWFFSQKQLGAHYFLGLLIAILAVSLSLYHLFIAYAGSVEAHVFRSTHLAFILILAFLLNPLGRRTWKDPLNKWFFLDCLFIVLIVVIQVYKLYDIDAFIWRRGDLNVWDLWFGTIFLILLLEATRRVVGWAMVIVAGFFLIHTAFSNYFPSVFYGPPSSWFTIIDYLFMRENGIFGIPLMVMATYIFLFILFGAFLIESGAGRFFLNIALGLTGHRPGGPAKASIIASGLMATVSGSAVANVVTTGSFTIPLMKRIKYAPYYAGAVEACASSGGQIMPPVMGAAAFIIAEFLNMPYLIVCLAALAPAVIYFFSIFVQVHFEARKKGLPTISKEEIPNLARELKQGGHLFLSIIIIIGALAIGYTPMLAGFYAIVSVLILSFFRAATRMTPISILRALEDGARKSVPVAVACATAGIIIGCVFVSGVGMKLTNLIIDIAAGRLWVALILTMFASMILGMGLTTTAVYITVAALVIPALVQMGVEPIAAHLFAFYFGLVSAITPPVALASFAAAGVAGANPMQTGVHSFRLGIAKYLLPLVFVYDPSMLFVGSPPEIAWGIFKGFLGIYMLTITTEGYLFARVNILSRILACALALMVLFPQLATDTIGVLGSILFIVLYYILTKRSLKAGAAA
ncbi:MAG: TRAP transporter permease [Desulfosalsimonas sp.]